MSENFLPARREGGGGVDLELFRAPPRATGIANSPAAAVIAISPSRNVRVLNATRARPSAALSSGETV